MSVPPLFYAPDLIGSTLFLGLPVDEVQHMTRSKRHGVGDTVYLTNGRGLLACAVIDDLDKRRNTIRLRCNSVEEHELQLPEVTLMCALPKGDRLQTLVDMVAQLGVSRIVPLKTEHCVLIPTDKLVSKMQRVAIAACKQSRRVWFPEVLPMQKLADVTFTPEQLALLGDHEGSTVNELLPQLQSQSHISIVVGPEGGMSDDELAHLEGQGCVKVAVGKNILRIETAAVAIMAACLTR